MGITVGEIQATLTLRDQLTAAVKQAASSSSIAMADIQSAVQKAAGTSSADLGKMQAAVMAADAQVAALRKQWNDFASAPAMQKEIEKELGDATVKAQILSNQLAKTQKDMADALKPPPEAPQQEGMWEKLVAGAGAYVAGLLAFTVGLDVAKGVFSAFTAEMDRSLAAWGKQEMATARLTAALKSSGTYTPEVMKQFDDLSSAYQRNTRYADEDINTTEALLVQIGNVMPSQMDKALRATTDLAAGLGIDLETATRLVAKAFAGHTETLARYGIIVSETELKTRGMEAVLDTITKHFGGQAAAAADTYTGRLDQMANAWNNVQEMVGKVIVQNPIVGLGLEAIGAALQKMNDAAGKSQDVWAVIVDKFVGADPVLAVMVNRILDLADAEMILYRNRRLIAGMPSPFDKLNEKGAAPPLFDPTQLTNAEKYQRIIQDVALSMDALTKVQVQTALSAFNAGASVDEAKAAMTKYWPEIDKADASLTKLYDAWKYNKEYSQKFQEAVAELQPYLASHTWDGTVEGLLKMGVSVETASIYMGEFKGNVEAVSTSLKAQNQIDEDWRDIKLKTAETVKQSDEQFAKAREATRTAVNAATASMFLTEAEYAQKRIAIFQTSEEKINSDWVAAVKKLGPEPAGELNATYKEAVAAIDGYFNTLAANAGLDFDFLKRSSRATLEDMAEKARQTYLFMTQHSEEFSRKAIQHAKKVADESEAAAEDTETAWNRTFDMFEDVDKILSNISGKFAELGAIAARTAENVMKNLEKGDTLGAAVSAVVGGIEAITKLGGPSEDEKAARSTFEAFQQQFGSMQQTIDAVGIAYAKMGKTGADAQRDLQRALDATHESAAAEAAALKPIQDVLAQVNALAQHGSDAISGFVSVAAGMTKPISDLQKQIDAAINGSGAASGSSASQADQRLRDRLAVYQDEIARTGHLAPEHQADYDAIQKSLYDLHNALDQTGALASQDKQLLADLGIQAVASFTAAVASGASEVDALKQISPALTQLQNAYKTLGLKVDDAALSALLMRNQIVTQNPELVQAISGLSQEMDALNAMGLLNADTLAAMERTGVAAYEQLKLKAKDLGASDKDTLGQMQKFLHDASDAAEKLGVPLDDNTQKLIDQSKEAGIWQDALTPQEKLMKGMQDLVDTVKDLIDQLRGIPPKIDTTVTTHLVTVNDTPDMPTSGYRQGDQYPYGEPIPMARGGFMHVTAPTLFLAGEAGSEDVAFSGGGQSFGGSDTSDIVDGLDAIHQLLAGLPFEIRQSVKNAVERTI